MTNKYNRQAFEKKFEGLFADIESEWGCADTDKDNLWQWIQTYARQVAIKELKGVLSSSSGGGNWRRNIETAINQLRNAK